MKIFFDIRNDSYTPVVSGVTTTVQWFHYLSNFSILQSKKYPIVLLWPDIHNERQFVLALEISLFKIIREYSKPQKRSSGEDDLRRTLA